MPAAAAANMWSMSSSLQALLSSPTPHDGAGYAAKPNDEQLQMDTVCTAQPQQPTWQGSPVAGHGSTMAFVACPTTFSAWSPALAHARERGKGKAAAPP